MPIRCKSNNIIDGIIKEDSSNDCLSWSLKLNYVVEMSIW